MKSSAITHTQAELALNSAAFFLQLVLSLPKLPTIMGFAEGKKEKGGGDTFP